MGSCRLVRESGPALGTPEMKFGTFQGSFHTLLERSLPRAGPELCWAHRDQAVTSGWLFQPCAGVWHHQDTLESGGASFQVLPEGFVSQEILQCPQLQPLGFPGPPSWQGQQGWVPPCAGGIARGYSCVFNPRLQAGIFPRWGKLG